MASEPVGRNTYIRLKKQSAAARITTQTLMQIVTTKMLGFRSTTRAGVSATGMVIIWLDFGGVVVMRFIALRSSDAAG